MITDFIRKFNGIYAPLTVRFGYNKLIAYKKVRNSPELKYLYRPLTLDRFIEQEIKENIYHVSIQKDDTVIDCGSHIGLFAMYCTIRGATVKAIEPVDENYELLTNNIMLNKFEHNITPIHKAVSGNTLYNKRTFYRTNNNGNGSLEPYNKSNPILVDTIAINDLLPCDILKIDIEGSEYEIIGNANLSLVKREIAIEYHTWNELRKQVLEMKLTIIHAGFDIDYEKKFGITGYLHATRIN